MLVPPPAFFYSDSAKRLMLRLLVIGCFISDEALTRSSDWTSEFFAVPCALMERDIQKEKAVKLLSKCERYFYRYLVIRDKAYIDRFFSSTKKLRRLIEKLQSKQIAE